MRVPELQAKKLRDDIDHVLYLFGEGTIARSRAVGMIVKLFTDRLDELKAAE